ncbi:MAG: hypothetical protein KDJ97_04445 [Anaerolineae bacterium]|nr:hypothetical protein [Anaerolineae bacterium]
MKLVRMLVMVVLLAGLVSPRLARAQTITPIVCGDGRYDMMLDDFDIATGDRYTPHPIIPDPVVTTTMGCHGTAVSIAYDLSNVAPPGSANEGQSWVVWRQALPTEVDISAATHLRVALRGGNENSHETVEIKLGDSDGQLAVISLPSLTDLPVWRPAYIDLRELSDIGSLNQHRITHVEIGIVRCENCEVADNPNDLLPPDEHTGTLLVDELAAVNLAPGATHRMTQSALAAVTPNATVRAAAAAALLNQVSASGPGAGLIPAWFPENNPNYNTFAQAEALLVFVAEYKNTGAGAYRAAAITLADKLIELQIDSGQAQAGAWFSAYTIDGNDLRPPDRAVPKDATERCDGDETMVLDPVSLELVASNIDSCQWVGNVGWALIALGSLQRSGIYPEPANLQSAIHHGAEWIAGQSAYRQMQATYPDLISLGIEGNVSAYFGLVAANHTQAAEKLGAAIFKFGWDDKLQRLRPGVGPADYATALDVSGSWGATFLRAIGQPEKALASQGYTASIMPTRSFDNSIVGYGDIAGPWTVAVEFSAQGAASGLYGADAVLTELYKLQITSGGDAGAFPGGKDHWYGGQLSPWTTTMSGVSPTAWVYFALNGNPIWIARTYLPVVVK